MTTSLANTPATHPTGEVLALPEASSATCTTTVDATATAASEALQTLREEPWGRKKEAMALLLQLTRNIAGAPGEIKYRRLNEFNKKLSADLFSVPGCLDFLHAIGFRSAPSGSQLILFEPGDEETVERSLNDDAALSIIHQSLRILEAFVKNETDCQYRKERDERIAAEKIADSSGPGKRKLRVASRPCVAAAPEEKVITVHLQCPTCTISLEVPDDESVRFLRAHVAKVRKCEAQQIRLVLASSGSMLRWDHQKIRDCGIADNSTIVFSVGAVDEMEQTNVRLKKTCGLVADVDTWKFTQEYLEEAVRKGLPSEKAKAFKRGLHSGQLTLKEIRNSIAEEMQEITGEDAPLAEIDTRFMRTLSQASVFVSQVEKDRAYSEEIAQHNALGIMLACRRNESCKRNEI